MFWSLDVAGNWSTFTDDGDERDRTHNEANEIETITGISSANIDYDAAGNMTKVAATSGYVLAAYDPWNRLVQIGSGAMAHKYYYDGLNRRVRRDIGMPGAPTYQYSYDTSWRVLEIRNEAKSHPEMRFVNGLRYVDDIICRLRDQDGNGNYTDYVGPPRDSILYYLTDANFNVTAVVGNGVSAQGVPTETSAVTERYHYDAYGRYTVLNGADDLADSSSTEWSVDGDTMPDDMNDRLYAGYQADLEVNFYLPGWYFARNRYYAAWLGRWSSRDPLNRDRPGGGYQDGMNLYQYVAGRPTVATDPMGAWRRVGGSGHIWCAESGDTLLTLAAKAEYGGNPHNWSCLWPTKDTKNHGYPVFVRPGDKYDV